MYIQYWMKWDANVEYLRAVKPSDTSLFWTLLGFSDCADYSTGSGSPPESRDVVMEAKVVAWSWQPVKSVNGWQKFFSEMAPC